MASRKYPPREIPGNPWPSFWRDAPYPRDPVDLLVYSDWLEEHGELAHAFDIRRDSRFWRLVRELEIAPHLLDSQLLKRMTYWWFRTPENPAEELAHSQYPVTDSHANIPKEIFFHLGVDEEGDSSNINFQFMELTEADIWQALRDAYWAWRGEQNQEWPETQPAG